MKRERGESGLGVAVLLTIISVAILAALFFGLPAWNVWRRGLSGEAQLREAEWNRQIAVQEAKAKSDAAVLLAEAEVARAKGVAQANLIIADGLKGHDEYLRYLWIMALEHTASQGGTVVYVPTEANLPIMEATRLK